MGLQHRFVAWRSSHDDLDGAFLRVGIVPIRAQLDDFVVEMDANLTTHGDDDRLAGLCLVALLEVRHQVGSDAGDTRFCTCLLYTSRCV